MNNEEIVNKAIEPLLEMYTKIESDLLSMIAEHFKSNAEFLNSDYWRIQKLEEMGLFNEEVIEYLAKYTNRTKEEILKALEEIGYDTFNINKLESAFENGKIRINPNTLIENNTIQNIINNAYNELSNHFIELSNKIANSTREAYLNIVEEAYLKTSMGTHSYQEAIIESLNSLGNKGITTLTYTTTDDAGNVIGIRNYDVEGTVRRDILTGVRSLSNDINKTTVEELECEWVYLSEHLRCRPTHFDWQGTIIKYEDLVNVTNYGDVAGLGGINCAHYFEPYFGDARGDELKSISKEDALEQYNLSQEQRYLERGIRKWKRKAEVWKSSDNVDQYNKCTDKVREWQSRLKNFTEEHNLRRDYTREYVAENNIIFNDNIIESDFEHLDNTVEHLIIYDINTNERLLHVTNNSKSSVGGKDAMKLLNKSKKNTLVAAHNHPSGSSFSLKDIETFNHYNSINLIVVNTNEYLYYLEKNDINKIKEKDLIKNYTSMKNKYYNLYGKNQETLHRLNSDFSKEMGWNYGRKNKKR